MGEGRVSQRATDSSRGHGRFIPFPFLSTTRNTTSLSRGYPAIMAHKILMQINVKKKKKAEIPVILAGP